MKCAACGDPIEMGKVVVGWPVYAPTERVAFEIPRHCLDDDEPEVSYCSRCCVEPHAIDPGRKH